MKNLKILFTVILTFGMSTFSTYSYAGDQKIESVSYYELDGKARMEAEALVNDYCTEVAKYQNGGTVSKYLQSGSGYIVVGSFGTASLPVIWPLAYSAAELLSPPSPTGRSKSIFTKALKSAPVKRAVFASIVYQPRLILIGSVGALSWGGTKIYRYFSKKNKINEKEEMTHQDLEKALAQYSTQGNSYDSLEESLESLCN